MQAAEPNPGSDPRQGLPLAPGKWKGGGKALLSACTWSLADCPGDCLHPPPFVSCQAPMPSLGVFSVCLSARLGSVCLHLSSRPGIL